MTDAIARLTEGKLSEKLSGGAARTPADDDNRRLLATERCPSKGCGSYPLC